MTEAGGYDMLHKSMKSTYTIISNGSDKAISVNIAIESTTRLAAFLQLTKHYFGIYGFLDSPSVTLHVHVHCKWIKSLSYLKCGRYVGM